MRSASPRTDPDASPRVALAARIGLAALLVCASTVGACSASRERRAPIGIASIVVVDAASGAPAPVDLRHAHGARTFTARAALVSRVDERTRAYLVPDRGWKRVELVDGARRVRTGSYVPIGSRPVALGLPLLPIELDARESRTVTLRFEGELDGWETPRTFVEGIEPASSVESNRQHERLELGVYAGFLLALALVNSLFARVLRDPLFVDYVLYSVPFGFMWIARDYVLAETLWPNAPYADDLLLFGFVCASIGFGNRFAMRFLETRVSLPRVHRLLALVNVLVALIVVFALFGWWRFVPTLLGLAALVTSGLYLVGGAVLSRRGLRQGRYFLIATSVAAVGTIIYTLWDFGALPTSAFTRFSAQMSSAIEMTILAFALTDRVRRIDEERHAAEARLRDGLEREVATRTAELERINDKLIELNQQLDAQSHTDALTGVANRRRFESALVDEWRRASRERGPISLLLVDVDHFKRFNDTYGHSAGDACLRIVAEVLAKGTRRVGDVIARYGGEEFVLILPNTGADAALVHAERLRELVAAAEIRPTDDSEPVSVTVSIGVATNEPIAGEAEGTKALFTRADEALYRAKREGRDRVVAASGPVLVASATRVPSA